MSKALEYKALRNLCAGLGVQPQGFVRLYDFFNKPHFPFRVYYLNKNVNL